MIEYVKCREDKYDGEATYGRVSYVNGELKSISVGFICSDTQLYEGGTVTPSTFKELVELVNAIDKAVRYNIQ